MKTELKNEKAEIKISDCMQSREPVHENGIFKIAGLWISEKASSVIVRGGLEFHTDLKEYLIVNGDIKVRNVIKILEAQGWADDKFITLKNILDLLKSQSEISAGKPIDGKLKTDGSWNVFPSKNKENKFCWVAVFYNKNYDAWFILQPDFSDKIFNRHFLIFP